MVEVNIVVSALAGVGSFLSPCILPILPAFLSYLGGTAANEAQNSVSSKTSQSVLYVESERSGEESRIFHKRRSKLRVRVCKKI